MSSTDTMVKPEDSLTGYAPVKGYKIYYEIHGEGKPMVLIHGGGSTIQTTFGRVLHTLASHHKVIAVELQGHGHTPYVDRLETFEDDADDVAAVLEFLKIPKADIFGFSNGANTAMQIAIRHPALVRKLVLGSGFFKREGMIPQFFPSMPKAELKDMPRQLQDHYLAVAPEPKNLIKMFENDRNRMVNFRDWSPKLLQSIKFPVLLISSDQDVVRPEHVVEMWRLFPHAKMAIMPGLHGAYLGEITTGMTGSRQPESTVTMVTEFLNEGVTRAD